MQKNFVRIAIAAVAISLSFSLSACSAITGEDTTADNTIVSTTPPVAAVTTAVATPVYPAVGNLQGVVVHGKSVKSYDPDTFGLTYTCAAGLNTVDVTIFKTVDYNGTAIAFTSQDLNYTPTATPDPQTYIKGIDQISATITFTGKAPLQAVSMIVRTINITSKVGPPADTFITNEDESVVTLTPEMLTPTGIILNTPDYSYGYIQDVEFCITP